MTQTEREILHDIVIDLRKIRSEALKQDLSQLQQSLAIQIDRIYALIGY